MQRASPDSPPRSHRYRRLTLRSAALLIAIIACGLGAYRYYERHVKKRTVSYPVADLILGRSAPTIRNQDDFASLVASIRSEVSPGSWQGQGGSATIAEFFLTDSLIVHNNEVAHERLAAFLRERRAAREGIGAPDSSLRRTRPAD
jgi:hypothetical protein